MHVRALRGIGINPPHQCQSPRRERIGKGKGGLVAVGWFDLRGLDRLTGRRPGEGLPGGTATAPGQHVSTRRAGRLRGAWGPRREDVIGPYQAELLQESGDGAVGDVDPPQRAEALGLLTEVLETGAAALATNQVSLDLGAPRRIKLAVEVAAQGEQAALHMAISRYTELNWRLAPARRRAAASGEHSSTRAISA